MDKIMPIKSFSSGDTTVPIQKGGTGSGGVTSKLMKQYGRNVARAMCQKKANKGGYK